MSAKPDPDCPICSNSTYGIPGCLVLDALQVSAARRRWQWAILDAGVNDCPCVQMQRLTLPNPSNEGGARG